MSAEPIGVMNCWECVEKHGRDLEHHLEDIIRVSRDPHERIQYESWIDQIREIRRFAHHTAKDIATDDDWKKLHERLRAIKAAGEKLAPKPKEAEFTDEEAERILLKSNPEQPIRRERGATTYTDVFHESVACHPSSHRAKKTADQRHVLTFCCPHGQWNPHLPAGQQCLASMMLQKIEHLHPEGRSSCRVCSAA